MAELRAAILNSGDPLASLEGKTATGRRLNVAKAVELPDPVVETPEFTPSPVRGGQPFSASAGFSDPVPQGPYSCTVDYGDGSGPRPGSISGQQCVGPQHTYMDEGTFTVTVTVRAGGREGSASAQVTVTAPLSVEPPALGPEPRYADKELVASASFTDPIAKGPYTCTVDYGDGSPAVAGSVADDVCRAPAHVYAGAGEYRVTVTVRSGSREASAAAEFAVTVAPLAVAQPELGPDPRYAGKPLTASAAISDPLDGASYLCSVDYGDGSPAVAGTVTGDECRGPAHVYAGAGDFTVTVTVRSASREASASREFAVTTAPVLVDRPVLGPAPVQAGRTLTASASFSDPIDAGGYSCTVDYGDGSPVQPGTVEGGECRGRAHVYLDAGTYIVAVTVRTGTRVGTASAEHAVAEPPASSKLVNVGGSLSSAAGEVRLGVDAGSGGGFLCASTPAGRLTAPEIDWLVIEERVARLRGTANLAGTERSFLVTVLDGGGSEDDRVRLQVWDGASGATVFDTGAPPSPLRGEASIRTRTLLDDLLAPVRSLLVDTAGGCLLRS